MSWRPVLRLMAILAILPVMLGQAGRFYPLLDNFNALLVPALILLCLLLALCFFRRDWLAGAIVAAGLLTGTIQLMVSLTSFPNMTGVGRLRVVTLSTWHANPDPAALARAIEAQAPDILLLQETNGTAAAMADTVLSGYFRLKSCPQEQCSEMIISRWPLRRIAAPDAVGRKLPDILAARVDAPFGPLHVINVHLPRPARDMAIPFRDELIAMVSHIDDGRLIMAGDFNLGTGSLALADLARRSGLRRIEGFIPTYPANLPIPAFIAIDHIFAGREWVAATCHGVDASSSDHHGIACDLR